MFWKEVLSWLSFFVKWESAVWQWKNMGKTSSYSLVMSLILTSVFIAFWFGLFEFFLRPTRIYLIAKRNRLLSRIGINSENNLIHRNLFDKLILWLERHRLRKCFFLCVIPIPLLPEATILAIKLSQNSKHWIITKEFWVVQAANAIKVSITVMVIYRFF